jgi:mono/diheme cytochrome c family protein
MSTHARIALRGCAIVAACIAAAASERAQADNALEPRIRGLLEKHCESCHDEGGDKGGLSVGELTGDFEKNGVAWKRIHGVVEARIMPPADEEPLSDDDRRHLLAWIEAQSKKFPGRTAARRLNREEFNNTLNDLLGLREDFAAKLPEDVTVSGFDTNAAALTMTGEAFEQYLEAIVTAVDWRFDSPGPTFEPIVVPAVPVQKPKGQKKQPEPRVALHNGGTHRSSTVLQQGNAVFIRPRFYKWNGNGLQPGLGIIFPEEFVATLPAAVDRFKVTFRVRSVAPPNCSLPRLVVAVNQKIMLDQPLEPHDEFQDVVFHFRKSGLNLQQSFEFHLANGYETKDFLEDFVPARDEFFQNFKKSSNLEGNELKNASQDAMGPWLDEKLPTIVVEQMIFQPAPYPEEPIPAHGLALTRVADMPSDARLKALETFLSRAYRRPLTPAEQTQLADFFARELSRTQSPQKAVQTVIMFALGSPRFLYLGARDPAAAPTDHDLAERLSYFLWSTTPDAALEAVARAGTLRTGRVLEEQVDRMLDHPNAERFFDRFAQQWLETGKLVDRHESTDPQYPTLQQAYLRTSLRSEGGALLQELFRGNRSGLAIVNSDFLVVNDRTSTHYGLPMVRGGQFRVVSLPEGSPYGGVATLASVMTSTEHGKFLPIYRGHWVQKNLFNRSLPPPPSDVPELDPNDPRFKNKPLRQQLTLHQEHPKCAVCHISMDPLGYAFQDFDPVGRFGKLAKLPKGTPPRSKGDTAGAFPNGERYAGIAEFRAILLEQYGDEVMRGFISKLIAYGRGREPSLGESEWIDRLVDQAKKNEYRMRPMLMSIVASPEFLH